MKKLITIFLLLFWATISTAQISTADGDSINCWEVTFWELNDSFTDGLNVTQGNTISLQWQQPLSSAIVPQPYTGIGDTTGAKHKFKLYTNNVSYTGLNGTADVVYDDYQVSLLPGVWAVTVRAEDMVGNLSQYSAAVWFIVDQAPDVPPLLPVELKIRVVR